LSVFLVKKTSRQLDKSTDCHLCSILSDISVRLVIDAQQFPKSSKISNMNLSYYPPLPTTNLLPVVEQLGHETIKALSILLIPTELLYFSLYFHLKGYYRVYKTLSFLSISTFWISPLIAPISCGPARCLQNFASTSGSIR
jgi:hypothetical protein